MRRIDLRFILWVALWAVVSNGLMVLVGIKDPPIPASIFIGGAAGVLSPWRLFRKESTE